jgi:hypothetical protein
MVTLRSFFLAGKCALKSPLCYACLHVFGADRLVPLAKASSWLRLAVRALLKALCDLLSLVYELQLSARTPTAGCSPGCCSCQVFVCGVQREASLQC